MVSETLEGTIIKVVGRNVTILVSVQKGEMVHKYEVELPITTELLDTAISNIGGGVRFCTWKGAIESLEPTL